MAMTMLAQEKKPTRPVLRYHGGKRTLGPWIISHFPPHEMYTEAFCGAASVLLLKPRCAAEIINDLNDDLVNLFRVLRDRTAAAELIRQLELTPFSYSEYLLAREAAVDPIERARRMIAVSFMSVGTDSTTRRGGSGFRSYSRPDMIGTIPSKQWETFPASLYAVVERLQGVVIESRDAAHVIKQHDTPRTLHYVDPPYPHSTRGKRRGHYRYEMTDDDHRKLGALLRSVKGMVIVSGYPCALYDEELYPDWRRVTKETLADSARPRTEVLWLNEAAWEARRAANPLFDHDSPDARPL